jgi:hypothetical protein
MTVQIPTQEKTFADPLPEARCIGCGYPLRGLHEPRCPECGRPFDPADVETYNPGLPVSWFMRYWLGAAGWILCAWPIASAVALAVVPYDDWDQPGPGRQWYAIGGRIWYWPLGSSSKSLVVLCWVALLVIWTVRAGMRWFFVRRFSLPAAMLRIDRPARRWTARWFLVGVFLAGCTIEQCPHAHYVSVWNLGGIAIGAGDGGPCYHYAKSSVHLAGPVWLFAPYSWGPTFLRTWRTWRW